MKSLIIFITSIISGMIPVLAFADVTDATSLFSEIVVILNSFIPVLIGAALVFFIYGLAKYIIIPDAEKREEAKNIIVYGIVFLFVMVSVWGLVTLVKSTLRIGTPESIPTQTRSL